MNDLVCVIDRRGSTLHYAAGVLTVKTPDQPPWHVGASQLSLLIVHGRVAADSTVWRGLAGAGVGVALTGGRHGDDVAWVGCGLATTGALRHRQHLAYAYPLQRVALARWVLGQKLLALQQALQANGGDKAVERALHRTTENLAMAADIDTLNGMEGALASQWFQYLGTHIDSKWRFAGRTRRPPQDPFNALISYGYALATADAMAAVQAVGLDPSLGFMHSLYPGRHALALDAVECLRPLVDGMALGLLDGPLTPDHFSIDASHGCRLNKAARSQLITTWHGLRRELAVPRVRRWAQDLRQQLGTTSEPASAQATLQSTIADLL